MDVVKELLQLIAPLNAGIALIERLQRLLREDDRSKLEAAYSEACVSLFKHPQVRALAPHQILLLNRFVGNERTKQALGNPIAALSPSDYLKAAYPVPVSGPLPYNRFVELFVQLFLTRCSAHASGTMPLEYQLPYANMIAELHDLGNMVRSQKSVDRLPLEPVARWLQNLAEDKGTAKLARHVVVLDGIVRDLEARRETCRDADLPRLLFQAHDLRLHFHHFVDRPENVLSQENQSSLKEMEKICGECGDNVMWAKYLARRGDGEKIAGDDKNAYDHLRESLRRISVPDDSLYPSLRSGLIVLGRMGWKREFRRLEGTLRTVVDKSGPHLPFQIVGHLWDGLAEGAALLYRARPEQGTKRLSINAMEEAEAILGRFEGDATRYIEFELRIRKLPLILDAFHVIDLGSERKAQVARNVAALARSAESGRLRNEMNQILVSLGEPPE